MNNSSLLNHCRFKPRAPFAIWIVWQVTCFCRRSLYFLRLFFSSIPQRTQASQAKYWSFYLRIIWTICTCRVSELIKKSKTAAGVSKHSFYFQKFYAKTLKKCKKKKCGEKSKGKKKPGLRLRRQLHKSQYRPETAEK